MSRKPTSNSVSVVNNYFFWSGACKYEYERTKLSDSISGVRKRSPTHGKNTPIKNYEMHSNVGWEINWMEIIALNKPYVCVLMCVVAYWFKNCDSMRRVFVMLHSVKNGEIQQPTHFHHMWSINYQFAFFSPFNFYLVLANFFLASFKLSVSFSLIWCDSHFPARRFHKIRCTLFFEAT